MDKHPEFNASAAADESKLGEIQAALKLIHQPGVVVELRALEVAFNPNHRTTWSGYFNNMEKLARSALRFSGHAAGVYGTLNPVDPDLLARAENLVIQSPKQTTTDRDIIHRNWFPIDFDPIRKSGISATDEERRVALDCMYACRQWLEDQGWPRPLVADSGNGYHLLYRIDLDNNDAATRLIQDALRALASRFSNGQVEIDTKTFNAARIWKLYGTAACKGSSTSDRPHRLAKLMDVPGGQ
jgi:hypothetical protein